MNEAITDITRCLRCGRTLSKPKSIQRKYGNQCWNKVKNQLHLDRFIPVEGNKHD